MTQSTARTIANVAVASAAMAAGYVVLRNPPLRRFAFRALRIWLGTSVPLYLVNEVRRAWSESAPAA
jgi:hypothetical protein